VIQPFEVRITSSLFDDVDHELRAGPRDDLESERAGFLLCGVGRLAGRTLLTARAWRPVPSAARVDVQGFGLAWEPTFNAQILDECDATHTVPVLIHRHDTDRDAGLSIRDREKGDPLLAQMSRLAIGRMAGNVVLHRGTAAGRWWSGGTDAGPLREFRIAGLPLTRIKPTPKSLQARRQRLDRQTLAIGPASEDALASAKVAIVGLSGGGSHVVQQLAHQGVGTLILVDDDVIEEENRGRVVGSRLGDDGRLKTFVMRRLARGIDQTIRAIEVPYPSSHPQGTAAIREADVVVACVDRFDARVEIEAVARRHLIPVVDVGMTLMSDGERLMSATGQVVLSLPGAPCLRCTPLLSDAVLESEARTAPPGYDRNPNAPGQAQVVSMNGLLASQAANLVLAIITGYLPRGKLSGGGWWQYDALEGQLDFTPLHVRRRKCPTCAEEGHGDSWST
jgi:molybdopterin/thiamine biosynthesis adenylyltransferase